MLCYHHTDCIPSHSTDAKQTIGWKRWVLEKTQQAHLLQRCVSQQGTLLFHRARTNCALVTRNTLWESARGLDTSHKCYTSARLPQNGPETSSFTRSIACCSVSKRTTRMMCHPNCRTKTQGKQFIVSIHTTTCSPSLLCCVERNFVPACLVRNEYLERLTL